MSLIRSEHLNEQAVSAAKEALSQAERDLEDARSMLEKKERKQYHEEQIWSDTIRRNSTWVTFGLMGVNIFLLLANLVVFEPWRRRRIVREVREALDEKSVVAGAGAAHEQTVAVVPALEKPSTQMEEAVDQVVEPAGVAIEELEASPVAKEHGLVEAAGPAVGEEPETVGKLPLAAGEVLPDEATDVNPTTPLGPELIPEPAESAKSLPPFSPETFEAYMEAYKQWFQDLFSERQVSLKKVDVTTIALEGAAAGVALMGFLFVLLRPR